LLRHWQVLILRYWSKSTEQVPVWFDFKENPYIIVKLKQQSPYCSFYSLNAIGMPNGTDEHKPFTHPPHNQTKTAAQFFPPSPTLHHAYTLNNEVNICFLGFKVNYQHTTKWIRINKTFSRHALH
jgi:hypothetical protein